MYQPSQVLLDKYADILVNFALNSGKGVKKGEVVMCVVPDVAKPFYGSLQRAILKAGAQPLMRFLATGFAKDFYNLANKDQLTFFPTRYLKARTKLIDHSIGILAEHDLHELEGVEPQKIMQTAEVQKPLRNWLNDKEYAGQFTWTLALYGTKAMADEVQMSLEEYWQQIIKACYLDVADPVNKWRELFGELNRIKKHLNAMRIDRLHMEASGTDLWISLGKNRQFVGGGGRNIPSFEIFTSPDWRGTEGVISFNQPLYRYGSLVTDVTLQFHKGRVVDFDAKKGKKLLEELIKRPNADKIGEFSLTDGSMSRITKFMANTLFDENRGGAQGNTHIALGMSYKDAYAGDIRKVTKKEWNLLGFNDSGEHTDIVSTTKRKVTAYLASGSTRVIYADGHFTF